MDSIEKYALFSGHSYDKNDQGAAHSANVTMITGTAMSDSANGVVPVDFGGNTISANDEQAVDVSTTCAVKEGDTVQVSVVGADGTAKSLLVTGVVAGGDRMESEISTATDTANQASRTAMTANESATKANELANTANEQANTAIKNANQANEYAQAAKTAAASAETNASKAMSDVETANSKIATLQENVNTMNSDISTAQDAISKNASDITGINQKLSTDYATKGEVSDVKVAVESEIDTKANALTASVAETYAAKSDVTKITDDLSNRISINEKGISSSSYEIKTLKSDTANISKDVTAAQDAASAAQKTADTAVSNANAAQTAANNAQSAVDNIQVGGRNLLLNTSSFRENTPFETSSSRMDHYLYEFNGKSIYSKEKLTKGTTIAVQGKSNIPWSSVHGGSSSNTNKAGFWICMADAPQDGSFTEMLDYTFLHGDDKSTEFKQIYTIPVDGYIQFRFNTYSDGTQIVDGKFWDIKAEIGNVCTDWTPAPEDIDATTDQLRDDLNSTESQLNTQITEVSKKTDSATSTANAAKDTAEAAKSTANTAIKSVEIQYAQNTSQTEVPSTGWQTDAPAWKEGSFIWQRTATTTADGTVSYSAALCITGIKGDDAVSLYIESSNGNVFKNANIATILTVDIYISGQLITDSTAMKNKFGDNAYLQWKQKEEGTKEWTDISSSDSRLSDDGFMFTVNTDDVNNRIVFSCELNY